jgi:hypothetical protein
VETAPGNFGPQIWVPIRNVAAELAQPANGCTPLSNRLPTGGIILIARGACDFSVKVLNAQNAGADAAIVYDVSSSTNAIGAMACGDNGCSNIVIPSVFVAQADGNKLKVRCAFFGRNLHSRMPLDPTHVRLKRTRV